MTARDALTRLRQLAANEQREILLSRREARRLIEAGRPDAHHGEPVEPPRDYAVDERQPFEARATFFTCERILIGSIVCLGLLALLLGFGE